MSQTLYIYTGSFDPSSGKYSIQSSASPLGSYTVSGSGPYSLNVGGTIYTYQGYDSSGAAVYSTNGGTTDVLISTSNALGTKSSEQADSSESSFGPSLSCFLTGTLISTPSGQAAVETLKAGDLAVLADGSVKPIIWVGHRSLNCATHPAQAAVLPIRIAAHAFGAQRPSRDLYLSPDHAVFAEGVLIPVKHLVNGDSIRQIAAAEITYWHIEVEGHQVVLAENLPVESYLENDNRDELEGGDSLVLHPVFAASTTSPLAPIVTQGAILQTVRDQIAARMMERLAVAA